MIDYRMSIQKDGHTQLIVSGYVTDQGEISLDVPNDVEPGSSIVIEWRPTEETHHPFRGHDGAPCLTSTGVGTSGYCDRPESHPVHHEGNYGVAGVETYACPDCGDDVSVGDDHVCDRRLRHNGDHDVDDETQALIDRAEYRGHQRGWKERGLRDALAPRADRQES